LWDAPVTDMIRVEDGRSDADKSCLAGEWWRVVRVVPVTASDFPPVDNERLPGDPASVI
jgi:hypothetical protein